VAAQPDRAAGRYGAIQAQAASLRSVSVASGAHGSLNGADEPCFARKNSVPTVAFVNNIEIWLAGKLVIA
jgi:hypothetical protein